MKEAGRERGGQKQRSGHKGQHEAEQRGLRCQPTPTTRDMCIYLYVSSCVELPRQGAGKGSKVRWHLYVVEMVSRQV